MAELSSMFKNAHRNLYGEAGLGTKVNAAAEKSGAKSGWDLAKKTEKAAASGDAPIELPKMSQDQLDTLWSTDPKDAIDVNTQLLKMGIKDTTGPQLEALFKTKPIPGAQSGGTVSPAGGFMSMFKGLFGG
jgi:hypothetical protein